MFLKIMDVEAEPKSKEQVETITFILPEDWKQNLAALAQDIRTRKNTLELEIITNLRQKGKTPFPEISLSKDPRLKDSYELLAFCEIDDALKRGMHASISPCMETDDRYPGPHIIIRTYISTTYVGWGLACSTLQVLGECGIQITEALEKGKFVILNPPTPPLSPLPQ